MSVDYEKLLKKALDAWIESEGCCWVPDPKYDLDVSEEERKVVVDMIRDIDPDRFLSM